MSDTSNIGYDDSVIYDVFMRRGDLRGYIHLTTLTQKQQMYRDLNKKRVSADTSKAYCDPDKGAL